MKVDNTDTLICPCGSKQPYMSCCGRFIENEERPETAEQEHIWELGEYITVELKNLIQTYGIEGEVGGLPPMPIFVFKSEDLDKKKKKAWISAVTLLSNDLFPNSNVWL